MCLSLLSGLRVYHENTVDLIAHYRAMELLRDVAGDGGIEDIYQRIVSALKQKPERPA